MRRTFRHPGINRLLTKAAEPNPQERMDGRPIRE